MLVIFSMLTGCNNTKSNEEAVAKVNDEIIAKAEFEKYVSFYKKGAEQNGNIAPDMWDNDSGTGKTYEEELREKTLEDLIVQEILLQKSEEANIKINEDEVDAEIEKFKETAQSQEAFDKYLEDMNITEEFFKDIYKTGMIISKYFEQTVIVPDNEAKEFYEEHKDLFDQVRARHILVDTAEEAMNILKQLDEGADFIELAKEKSTCPSAQNGGDLGYFKRGEMVKEFEKMAFILGVGEVSSVVKTEFGYHLIKVEDKKVTFDDNRDAVIESIKNMKFEEMLNNFRQEADVEILIDYQNDEETNSEETNKESE